MRNNESIMAELEQLISSLQRTYSRFKDHPSGMELDLMKDKVRQLYEMLSEYETEEGRRIEKREEGTEKWSEAKASDIPPEAGGAEENGAAAQGNGITLADKFMDADDNTIVARITRQPINDLKTAIGLSDKFEFIRELFNNNLLEYNEAIDKLNSAGSLQEATSLFSKLREKYDWDGEMEPVQRLKAFIERKHP